jgi:hypothetical protein
VIDLFDGFRNPKSPYFHLSEEIRTDKAGRNLIRSKTAIRVKCMSNPKSMTPLFICEAKRTFRKESAEAVIADRPVLKD